MTQQLYWHAPLWEVLLIIAITFATLFWVMLRLLRKPRVIDALIHVSPVFSEQPLWFFSQSQGIQPLNEIGRQMTATLVDREQRLQRNRFFDIAFEAITESRQIIEKDWANGTNTLLVIPIISSTKQETGLLITLLPTPPAATTESMSKEIAAITPLADDAPEAPMSITVKREQWLIVGQELQIHPTQPLIAVQRIADVGSPLWQEQSLTYLEETLIRYLLTCCNEVQRAELLFSTVWPDDEVDRVGLRPDQKDRLRRLVYQLRQRIEPDPRNPHYLQTAHGVGYTLYSETIDGKTRR